MDFDDAYANMPHIPDAPIFVAEWPEKAAAFRAIWQHKRLDIAYGSKPRQRFDLFQPEGWQRVLLFSSWRILARLCQG